ncbi:MAG: trypsin-like serine protease [Chthoniobacterales bacterium]
MFRCFVAALLLSLTPAAHAVVINTGDGKGNTNAPADDPGWANVGYINGASGIYLGAGWVLTAAHVGAGNISFSGISYSPLAGSSIVLTNSTIGRTTNTDLLMFQLASTPAGLGPLTLASSAPTLGTGVTMIGAGRDRGAFTKWNVNTNTTPWTWTETSSQTPNAAGYQTLEANSMRWGTNTVSTNNLWVSVANGSRDVTSFVTTFTDTVSASDEAQAVLGDSGGAVFTKKESGWELSGAIFAVGGYSGQPSAATNAIFGNVTYSADLSYYAPQILSIVPEPSTYALIAFSAAALAFARRRRR